MIENSRYIWKRIGQISGVLGYMSVVPRAMVELGVTQYSVVPEWFAYFYVLGVLIMMKLISFETIKSGSLSTLHNRVQVILLLTPAVLLIVPLFDGSLTDSIYIAALICWSASLVAWFVEAFVCRDREDGVPDDPTEVLSND